MNILFIEPHLRTDKLGFLYLSAIMKQHGHSVLLHVGREVIEEKVEAFKPEFIMYSVQTGEHDWYIDLNKELKFKFKFKSVFGGAHFTFYPEKYLQEESMDYIVQGPGENVIMDILENKITTKFIKGSLIHDPDAYPEPDRDLLYSYEPLANAGIKRFIASRDCPNACSYCFNHRYHRIYNDQKHCFFKRRSPQKFVDEIKRVKDKWNLEVVYFNDDDIANDKEWTYEFLDLYKKEIDLPFCGSARANNMSLEIATRLADAGCTFLNMALESAVPSTQKMLRRGNISNQQIIDACKICDEVGIRIRLQNIIGLPVNDPFEDAMETLKMNQLINPYDSWSAILQPYPGTDIFDVCIEKGILDPNFNPVNFFDHTPLKIYCATEINTLHKLWFFAVKHQIDPEFIKLLCKQPLTNEVSMSIQKYRWSMTAENVYSKRK